MEEVASTLRPSRVDVSKEETRTSESVHAPSVVVLLDSESVWVSVVGVLDRRSVGFCSTAAFDMIEKNFSKFLSDHIQVRAVFKAGVYVSPAAMRITPARPAGTVALPPVFRLQGSTVPSLFKAKL